MREVIWSQPALDDLRRIGEWLDNQASPEVALEMLVAIRGRCQAFEDFPARGAPIHDGLRKLIVSATPYIILYRMKDHVIEVVRLYHERENWKLGA